jgi:hypothetical protein
MVDISILGFIIAVILLQIHGNFLILTDLGVTNHFNGLRDIIDSFLSLFSKRIQPKNALI